MRTSISCPFSCTFCGFPEHAGPYQTAPIEAVEKELNRVAGIGTVKCLQFIDDTFNVPSKRFKEILRMIINNKYNFQWYSHLRCQYLDEEMIELMKKSGCQGVFLGIESGNQQILKNMNKQVNVEKYLKGIALLKKYDILTHGSFIIGFPGETAQTVKDTFTFIKESGIDFYRAQLWYCDTITPIWKQREKYNIKGSHFEWSHATTDSKQACDTIDDLFLSIEKPIWVPQYNFEFNGIFHLLHRGITLDQVKNFIKSFNNGIKEKLSYPGPKEVSLEVIKQLRRPFQTNTNPNNPQERQKTIVDYNLDFDFN
jgi:radical SAM PhpK family P-methyltransferase